MVLGHKCFASPKAFRNRTWQSIAADAKARIDQFAFVGLVSEMFLSQCLFNYMQTGARFVTPFQAKRCNPTHVNVTRMGMTAEQAFNASSLPYDHLDHAVFAHAQKRFWADVAASGVSYRSCAANMTHKTYGCQSWRLAMNRMRQDHARIVADVRNISSTCVAGACYTRTGPPGHNPFACSCYGTTGRPPSTRHGTGLFRQD